VVTASRSAVLLYTRGVGRSIHPCMYLYGKGVLFETQVFWFRVVVLCGCMTNCLCHSLGGWDPIVVSPMVIHAGIPF